MVGAPLLMLVGFFCAPALLLKSSSLGLQEFNLLQTQRKHQCAASAQYLSILLIFAFELTDNPWIRRITRLISNPREETHAIAFEGRIGVAHVDFAQPAARANPIG